MVTRASVLVGVMVGFLAGLLACDRGPKHLPESGFQVEFPAHKIPSELKARQTVAADVSVKNISPVAWPSQPDQKDRYAVTLSYHWVDRKGEMVVFDGLRTNLPHDLKPGESVDLKASIQAPEKPGRYTLEVTLVQERSAWFPEKKGAKLVVPVTVTESAASSSMAAADTSKAEAQSAAGEKPLKKAPALQTAAKNEKAGAAGGPWTVQLGSFSDKKVAANLADKLKAKGYDAYVTAVKVKGKELHRVRVGRLAQRAEAEKLRETLKSAEKLDRAVVAGR